MTKRSVRTMITLQVAMLLCITSLAQEAEDFSKVYANFKNLTSMAFNGSAKSYGKDADRAFVLKGRFVLRKKDFDLMRYRAFATCEIPLTNKINFEDNIYDGADVYQFSSEKEGYINYGKWDQGGKSRTGYSAGLYGVLFAAFGQFDKNKEKILAKAVAGGYEYRLPASGESNEVIMLFGKDSPMPYKIIYYGDATGEKYREFLYYDADVSNELPDYLFRPLGTVSASAASSGAKETSVTSDLLAVGTMAPNWELSDADKRNVKLSDYKGKVVLMDFWATWCAPCVAAQPALEEIHKKYSGQGLVVLGMDYDESAAKAPDLNAYKARKKLTYGMIYNAEKIGKKYHIEGVPVAYVIDKSGKIVFSALGYNEQNEKNLIAAVEKALQ